MALYNTYLYIIICYYHKPHYQIFIVNFFSKTAFLLIKLLIFLISKLAISVAFSVIYILTVEIFPTRMRATLLSVCSMIGRVGSMVAPQVMLLVRKMSHYIMSQRSDYERPVKSRLCQCRIKYPI